MPNVDSLDSPTTSNISLLESPILHSGTISFGLRNHDNLSLMKLSALPYQFLKPFSLKDDTNMAQLDDIMRKKMNKIRNNLRVIFLKIKNVEEIFPKLPSYHIIA